MSYRLGLRCCTGGQAIFAGLGLGTINTSDSSERSFLSSSAGVEEEEEEDDDDDEEEDTGRG
jgi:hypothetical protein